MEFTAGRGPRSARLLAAIALTVGASGCGLDSPALDVPPQTGVTGALTPAPASGVPSTYAGLGSRTRAFARGHHEAPLAGAAKDGSGPITSSVTSDTAGRVTGYVVTFNYRPRLSDVQRLASAVGISDLPADRITTRSTATCIVYASPTMRRLVGALYTGVTTTPSSSTARVRTTPTPVC
jgi:hypothetical protein